MLSKAKTKKNQIRIGTAGWSIPGPAKVHFSPDGTYLEKYSKIFNAVEINSSFYRDHKTETYIRWRDSVPKNFKFSVKLFKKYTHLQRLEIDKDELKVTLDGIRGLEDKWGMLLVQLPPSLNYLPKTADNFFSTLRKFYQGDLALEPRHISWQEATKLFEKHQISRVLADPELCPMPDLDNETAPYYRLHGSPKMYYSSYSSTALENLSEDLLKEKRGWCIFDNTAHAHATLNALELKEILA